MGIYAEACHTTAISYQSAICFTKGYGHCHVLPCCSNEPPLFSPPQSHLETLRGRQRGAGFCLVAPGGMLLLLLLALGSLLENSTYYTGDSHHLVFKNTSQMQRSKGFQKTKPVLAAQLLQAVFSAPINWEAQRAKVKFLGAGCSEGAAVPSLWKMTVSILLHSPSNRSTASGAFLELPCPSRLQVFVPLCPSSCWGVGTFTVLLLLGQADAATRSIKIWIMSNRRDYCH